MFESIREAFRDLLQQRPDPETRRDALARMRETLVRARMGVDDLRRAVADSERAVAAERAEVEKMRRRRVLAERIQDEETVRLAVRWEEQHAQRLSILERKLAAQRDELALLEREVSEMTADYRLAAKGGIPGQVGASARSEVDDPLDDSATASAFDAMQASRRRADREARADEMLEALKRRMGK